MQSAHTSRTPRYCHTALGSSGAAHVRSLWGCCEAVELCSRPSQHQLDWCAYRSSLPPTMQWPKTALITGQDRSHLPELLL